MSERPLLAISSCLLGENVRYDGAHKKDHWLIRELGRYVDYRAICPEVAIGLGVPRQPIRLLKINEDIRAVGVSDATLDVTEALQNYAFDTVPSLGDISAYVFKSKSPSCGVFRVKQYHPNGMATAKGAGVYAEVIGQQMPDLPMEEEGRLCDPVLRENFVSRLFTYHRWQRLLMDDLHSASLIDFHMRHKYLLMAHSQAAYQRLGRLLSNLKGQDLRQVAKAYQSELMSALNRKVSRARHANVLQHLQGYLKKAIKAGDKVEIADNIAAYHRGELPLVVPIKLLAHYFRCYPNDYIAAQAYLQPYPDALGLRNAI